MGTVTHLKEGKETWQENVVDPGAEAGLILVRKLEKSIQRGKYHYVNLFLLIVLGFEYVNCGERTTRWRSVIFLYFL